jgi:alkanesulfonate monooxygenase SsuD/methylene tetrahydromethanopterin reductase-like flavin-dependent oxidoreductase (luciferase family)
MRFGTGANLLQYNQLVALAYRLMALDHMAKGRLMAGFGAGAFPSGAQLFGTDLEADNREMLLEGHDLIKATRNADDKPVQIRGKHFSVDIPEYDRELGIGGHWRPYTPGGPRTAIAGFSPNSSTLRTGGERGDIPLSISTNADYLLGHWQCYEEGARLGGHPPDRSEWRVVRDVVVGDTDDAAMELALSAPIRRIWDEWLIPFHKPHGLLDIVAPDAPDKDAVDAEYIARHAWVVGSPETVIARLQTEQEQCGGFGVLLVYSYDFHAQPERFRRHLELLAREDLPALRQGVPALS